MLADWIGEALYQYLASNATVAAMVSTYDGRPAVFFGDSVPEGADLPFIWVQPALADSAADSKTTRARVRRYVLGIYAAADGRAAWVDDASERLRGELHRASIISGEGAFVVTAADIVGAAPSSEQIVGRLIQFTVRFAER
jgi:hypothetical protein